MKLQTAFGPLPSLSVPLGGAVGSHSCGRQGRELRRQEIGLGLLITPPNAPDQAWHTVWLSMFLVHRHKSGIGLLPDHPMLHLLSLRLSPQQDTGV